MAKDDDFAARASGLAPGDKKDDFASRIGATCRKSRLAAGVAAAASVAATDDKHRRVEEIRQLVSRPASAPREDYVDRPTPSAVSSEVHCAVDPGDSSPEKDSGDQGLNLTAAGVGTMAESKGTAKGDVRQGSDEEDAFADPPGAGEQARATPPRKAAEEAFQEQTAEYTLECLTPQMRRYARVGNRVWDEVCDAPMQWAWDGVAGEYAHVEISGPSFSGKTTLAFAIAVASASTVGPVEVLGRAVAPVPVGKAVLIVEEENDERSCGQKLRAACEMLGLDPDKTLARVVTVPRSGFCPGSEVAELVRADAARGVYGRIFLDSKARIFYKERANVEEDQAFTARWITDLINRGDCSVWIVSHTRKGRASEIEDMAGSGQRGACADTVLLVTAKHAKDSSEVLSTRVVYKKIRENDENDAKPTAVVFTLRRDADKKWRISHAEVVAEEEGEDAPLTERIVATIRASEDGWVSERALRERVHVGPAKLRDAVDQLVAGKRVVRCRSTSGSDAMGVRLRMDSDFDRFEELVPKDDVDDD